jgi:hypothetical protein
MSRVEGRIDGCRQSGRDGGDGDDVIGSVDDFEDKGETALKTNEKRCEVLVCEDQTFLCLYIFNKIGGSSR